MLGEAEAATRPISKATEVGAYGPASYRAGVEREEIVALRAWIKKQDGEIGRSGCCLREQLHTFV